MQFGDEWEADEWFAAGVFEFDGLVAVGNGGAECAFEGGTAVFPGKVFSFVGQVAVVAAQVAAVGNVQPGR